MASSQATESFCSDVTSTTRSRRSSSGLSLPTSLSRSTSNVTSNVGSPRVACPRDSDAFSYDPSNLTAFLLPNTTWEHLPSAFKSTIVALQHAAAALVTGFDRLEAHRDDPYYNELSQFDSLPPPAVHITESATSSPPASVSPSCQSVDGSPRPSRAERTDKPRFPRERSFSSPLRPRKAYFITELSHLKIEALPRLWHLSKKMELEWDGLKGKGGIPAEEVRPFNNWWTDTKYRLIELDRKIGNLAEDYDVPNTGRGWSVL